MALTLGVTYLTVLAHQRSRQAQSHSLRSQTYALHSVVEPVPPPAPLTRAEIAAQARASFVETAKERWNQEVEGAVRWVQRTDWAEVREGIEDKVARLLGTTLAEAEAEAETAAREVVDSARSQVSAAGTSVSTTARNAMEGTKATAEQIRDSIESAAGAHATTVKNTVTSAVQQSLEKGREVVGKATDKASAAVGVVGATTGTETLSPVERALRQRYERPATTTKSVADALRERYLPAEQRDTSLLRGV